MEKELNIADLLKDKPKGTKLYFVLSNGECFLNEVSEDKIYIDIDNRERFWCLSAKGSTCSFSNGCVLLFPSNKMRDWSKFAWKRGDVLVSNDGCVEVIFDKWYDDTYTNFYVKHYLNSENENNIMYFEAFICVTDRYSIEKGDAAQTYINTIEERLGGKLNMGTLKIEKSQPEFKDGDIVYSEEDEERYPSISILNLNNKDCKCYYLWSIPIKKREVILYNVPLLDDEVNRFRYATDEEKQRLFDALAKNGKAWDAEKKQIVDLKPKVEFKQFQKVLTRDNNTQKWEAELFGFKNDDNGFYHCVGGTWKYCIPYEGNESLLGTIKDVEE